MTTQADKGKNKSHQPNPPHAKGFNPKQNQDAKGYDVNPHGSNAKVNRSKIALQHTHKHGRGEG